jgi:capsular exopolysaccharide synthesis family protein
VSKFFKALEKVEQERDAAAVERDPAPAPTARVAVVEPRRPPARETSAPSAGAAPAVPAPAAPPPTARPEPAPARLTPPASRPMAYGAPVARPATSRRGFAWQMEPAAGSEVGDIDDHLVSLLAPTSFAAEQYRAVRLAIETLHHERGTRVVAVSSPGRGDGRTITALNLAGALAQASDTRVALVEADLRHPSVARYLGLPNARGLSSYLLEPTMSMDHVLQRPASIAFAVLPAGTVSSMPYELLKSPRLGALIAELRLQYDYVLVDTPSVLHAPDVAILRDLVDGFVVVVRANRTPREQLADTMNVLGRERTLGLVFNDDERSGVPTFEAEGEAGWRRLVPRPLGTVRG